MLVVWLPVVLAAVAAAQGCVVDVTDDTGATATYNLCPLAGSTEYLAMGAGDTQSLFSFSVLSEVPPQPGCAPGDGAAVAVFEVTPDAVAVARSAAEACLVKGRLPGRVEPLDPTDASIGVAIVYTGDGRCVRGDQTFSVELVCDRGAGAGTPGRVEVEGCAYKTLWPSSYGCPGGAGDDDDDGATPSQSQASDDECLVTITNESGEVATFDICALVDGTSYRLVDPSSSFYSYEAALLREASVPEPCENIPGGVAAIEIYDDGSQVLCYVQGRLPGRPEPIDEADLSVGVAFVYTGPRYCNLGGNQTFAVHVVCDETAGVGTPGNVTFSRGCEYKTTWPSIHGCPLTYVGTQSLSQSETESTSMTMSQSQSPESQSQSQSQSQSRSLVDAERCFVTTTNDTGFVATFDLCDLADGTTYEIWPPTNSGYHYLFNVLGAPPIPADCPYIPAGVAVIGVPHYTNKECWVEGRLPPRVVARDNRDLAAGVRLVHTGDRDPACGERTFIVDFICDPDAGVGSPGKTGFPDCQVSSEWRSSYACPVDIAQSGASSLAITSLALLLPLFIL